MHISGDSKTPQVPQSVKEDAQFPKELETQIAEYCKKEIDLVNQDFQSTFDKIDQTITAHEYQQAENLTAGVSGAKKIQLDGKEYVLKPQVFSETFRKNYKVASEKGEIQHRNISESDDSFAHFPRKEVLGHHLAKAFNLDVPKTKLVNIEGQGIASLQVFLPKDKTTTLLKAPNVSPTELDYNSAMNTLLFQMVTENIDGHAGNIMLEELDTSDDDEDALSQNKIIPIDYGLIFPRHGYGIYPTESNLVKKGLFKLYENRKIDVKKFVSKLPDTVNFLNDPQIRNLATDNEKKILLENLKALKAVAAEAKGSMTVAELLTTFIDKKIKMKEL